MTEDQTPGTGPDEVERRDYAALVDSLASSLDLRGGLAEAVDVAGYTAMSSHIASLLNLETGLQSALTAHRGTGQPPEPGTTTTVADLLRRAGAGDPAAWREIVRRYSGVVFATVHSFRFQDADAADAVQMTWLRLAENCHRIQRPERLGGWLATTASRECLRILRHQAQHPPTPHDADEPLLYADVARATGIPPVEIGPTRGRLLRQLRQLLEERGLAAAVRALKTSLSDLIAPDVLDREREQLDEQRKALERELRFERERYSTETREMALDEDRAPVTVYVIAEPHDPLSVRQGRSSASGANFIGNDRVVIGDGIEVRLSSEYRIARVEVDAERMMESLSPRAQKALRKLIANPSDAVANKEFRRALRPPEGPAVPSVRDLQHQSVVSTPVNITTIDCDVVAIGDNQRHDVTIKHRVATASLDIAEIMKDSAELASAFARQLSPTERNHRRGELDRALTEAVTPKHLWSVVSTVPGRSPRIVAGCGSVTAVDAPVSIVGEKSKFTRETPDVTAGHIETLPSLGSSDLPAAARMNEIQGVQLYRDNISDPRMKI